MTPQGYQLVFADEFDGDTLDPHKWTCVLGTGSQHGIKYWGNDEQQYYTQDNITVADGALVITAQHQAMGDRAYTSGRLTTRAKFCARWGYFQARMRLPAVEGAWPAFWLMPEQSHYGRWPRSGEIDIMEARGRIPSQTLSTIHFGLDGVRVLASSQPLALPNGGTIADWHTYAVEWLPDRMHFFVDDHQIWSVDSATWAQDGSHAPFDREFHIILNLAVGGTFDPPARLQPSAFPCSMSVDYVRVFRRRDTQ